MPGCSPGVRRMMALVGCDTSFDHGRGRFKQSAMFWTVKGANAIIALRCNRPGGKFEHYWAAHRETA